MSKNDGGPAFPRTATNPSDVHFTDPGADGMTLRDYFAAAAFSTLGQLFSGNTTITVKTKSGDLDEEAFAIQAYKFADAMLAERAK